MPALQSNTSGSPQSMKCNIPGCEQDACELCWIGNKLHARGTTSAEAAMAHFYTSYKSDLLELVQKSQRTLFRESILEPEDVIHEVCYVLKRDEDKIDESTCLLPLARTITYRTAVTEFRKRISVEQKYFTRTDILENEPEHITQEDTQLFKLALDQCWDLVLAILKRRKFKHQKAWLMMRRDSYKLKEISEHFRVSADTIRKDWIYPIDNIMKTSEEIKACVQSLDQ